ncbi:hypothetical protein BS50DRAFT_577448 [Corynespora cassiicola Philippines]|uniref:Uncharacterized protein n=1 Tax=Corynespora cassiicola Philippines TaxID=1448308 RepID=A0A2T2NAR8_CORCC|nr:hypothetical protein BS50DRAFT_577448 [Corynespora cassiicola Philippines]
MSAEHHTGHCRAQRVALDFYCTEQCGKPKPNSTSCEGWPWRQTIDMTLQEDNWQGCCSSPVEKVEAIFSRRSGDEEVHSQSSSGTTTPSARSASPCLWNSTSSTPCATCGRKGALAHH